MYNKTFHTAFEKLIQLEGAYSNDPIDKGGETFCGISRNNFPKWIGWNIIDHYKSSNHFNELLKSDFVLLEHVQDFYYNNFWLKMNCNLLPTHIAKELFELSVNTGIKRATIILQTTLNVLNNNQKLYSDIQTDGKFGSITLATLQTALESVNNKLIFNVINILQGCFYIELMINNPLYEKYVGWFNRVVIEH